MSVLQKRLSISIEPYLQPLTGHVRKWTTAGGAGVRISEERIRAYQQAVQGVWLAVLCSTQTRIPELNTALLRVQSKVFRQWMDPAQHGARICAYFLAEDNPAAASPDFLLYEQHPAALGIHPMAIVPGLMAPDSIALTRAALQGIFYPDKDWHDHEDFVGAIHALRCELADEARENNEGLDLRAYFSKLPRVNFIFPMEMTEAFNGYIHAAVSAVFERVEWHARRSHFSQLPGSAFFARLLQDLQQGTGLLAVSLRPNQPNHIEAPAVAEQNGKRIYSIWIKEPDIILELDAFDWFKVCMAMSDPSKLELAGHVTDSEPRWIVNMAQVWEQAEQHPVQSGTRDATQVVIDQLLADPASVKPIDE